ncbi:MAG: family 78 glycoside hydrolase catalytic domain, partial [Draconibacterium sp.]|nr:family 78 glycoside hydrolase catalytic domain [Draconibacterium sp.]
YELYINGKKVGDHVLAPNQTNYDSRQENSFENGRVANMSTRILYETFDISDYLKEGENVAAVILGNGWYYRTERDEFLYMYSNLPRFISQIEIENADKSKQIIVSNETWKMGTGPIIENSIYYGEVYDARLEELNWNLSDFDDSNWENSKVVRTPDGDLRAQMSEPDRVVDVIQPVSVSTPNKGVYRYDFGTMFSGWVKLKVSGGKGTKLKLTFFEDNGNTYEQTDTYILKGEGVEEWEPRLTWHSFRYVEISGSPTKLTIDNLEGQVVNTDIKSASTFTCSNKLFNRILSDYRKTQLGNIHGGVPSDCPHRERRGYTGDGQIAAQAAIYNFNTQSFYTKWINDIADAQNSKTGYVPCTAPYQSGGGGTPWGSAYIIMPWYMYLYYGDVTILDQHYEGMKKYIKYLAGQTDGEGLIVETDLGEWVPPTPTEIPPSFVSSAYYFYDLTLMAKMAEVLGKDADAVSFQETAEETKLAFNKRYYNAEKYSYSIGWQGANVFPLAFGMVEKEQIKNVFKTLVHNVEVNTKGHFDTGMMGVPYLLEVLTKYERPDLAYTVMNRRDFPSFGYNIERGATTLWETWSGKDSHSHPMFGSACAWYFQGLAGINPDPENPGFKHIIIKPNPIDELDFSNTTYSSVHGDITSNWEYKNGVLKLLVEIPANTTASVFVPGINVDDVSFDDSTVKFIGVENDFLHYEIQSGKYTFISKKLGDLIQTPMLSIPVIYPPDSTLFSPDSVLVNIRQYSKNAEIRFTLDGSEPNENSELFTEPFILRNSAVVKARVFKVGLKPGFTKSNRIVFIDSLTNGINYKYFIGEWNKLPDFEKLKPVKSGTVYNFDLNEFENLDDKFGIVFTCDLEIANEDIYTFFLSSNDGSKLFIDNKLIVDADGPHGFAGEIGAIKLDSGKHNLRLEYFQAGGGKGLELQYKSAVTEKHKIPANVLFRK